MSTAERIRELVEEGRLIAYVPPNTRRPIKRRLFITKEMLAVLQNPNSVINNLRLRGFVENALTRWVLGDRIYVEFMKRLEGPPKEIWEIRITPPVPQLRIFGRFADPDTFLVLGFHLRPTLGNRKTRRGRQAWRQAMDGCAGEWSKRFPHHLPFAAVYASDYVTEKCDELELN